MDSYEINKIAGAVLFTCMVTLLLNIGAGAVFTPGKFEKPGYEIAVPEAAPAAGGDAAAGAQSDQPIETLLASADVARGDTSHKKCLTCHTFGKGEPNKIGPNLYGVVGRARASVAGFNYSAALKAKGGEWTFDELNKFLQKPAGYIPGTSMAFPGVARGGERGDLIAFLNSKSDSPAPLPKAADAAGAGEADKAPASKTPAGEAPAGQPAPPPPPTPPPAQ